MIVPLTVLAVLGLCVFLLTLCIDLALLDNLALLDGLAVLGSIMLFSGLALVGTLALLSTLALLDDIALLTRLDLLDVCIAHVDLAIASIPGLFDRVRSITICLDGNETILEHRLGRQAW